MKLFVTGFLKFPGSMTVHVTAFVLFWPIPLTTASESTSILDSRRPFSITWFSHRLTVAPVLLNAIKSIFVNVNVNVCGTI